MNVEKYSAEFLERLVRSLIELPEEPTWVEFKVNCVDKRHPYVYPSLKVAAKSEGVAQYLDSRGFDTKFYKQRILEFLCAKGCASIGEIVETLDKFLPKSRPAKANRRRIVNLLSVTMGKKEGLVFNAMPRQSKWSLTGKGRQICRSGNSSCKRACHQ